MHKAAAHLSGTKSKAAHLPPFEAAHAVLLQESAASGFQHCNLSTKLNYYNRYNAHGGSPASLSSRPRHPLTGRQQPADHPAFGVIFHCYNCCNKHDASPASLSGRPRHPLTRKQQPADPPGSGPAARQLSSTCRALSACRTGDVIYKKYKNDMFVAEMFNLCRNFLPCVVTACRITLNCCAAATLDKEKMHKQRGQLEQVKPAPLMPPMQLLHRSVNPCACLQSMQGGCYGCCCCC